MELSPFNITCKWAKLSRPSFHLFGLLMACGILVSSCKPSEQGVGTQSPANVPKDVSEDQSVTAQGKPKINFVATEKLYKKMKQKKIGAGGNPRFIALHQNKGIMIHPGNTPTEVVFDVSGMKQTLKLAFWIGQFPQNAVSLSKEGTAGFEVFVDGKSLGRQRVDRLTNQALLVNPLGVSRLRIVVDNDDGANVCDWFYMGLQ